MQAITKELESLLEREQIRDCIGRLARGEDRRNAEVIGGRYLDRMEKRGGEWRIAQRTMLYDWFHDFGLSIDWSKGLMGLPLSAGHYSGRPVGDYSEIFFGKRPSAP
jgi:hypothetical protein